MNHGQTPEPIRRAHHSHCVQQWLKECVQKDLVSNSSPRNCMRPMGLPVYQAYKESQHIKQQLDTLVIDILDVHVLQCFLKIDF